MQNYALVILFYIKISIFPSNLKIDHSVFLKIKTNYKVKNFSIFILMFSHFSRKNLSSPQEKFAKPRKIINFSSNQGKLREEILVKWRQPSVRKTRQVKVDFGKTFSSKQGVWSFCKKIQIKANSARNLLQIEAAFGKKNSSD